MLDLRYGLNLALAKDGIEIGDLKNFEEPRGLRWIWLYNFLCEFLNNGMNYGCTMVVAVTKLLWTANVGKDWKGNKIPRG